MINKQNFLLEEIPQYHPASEQYLLFWREQKQRCIEGYWVGGVWMPGTLYFYVNFWTILLNKSAHSKTKEPGKPFLRDLEWDFYYNWTEARGFSGFSDDKEFTCDREYEEVGKDPKGRTYIHAREYMRKTFPRNMGRPLYLNEAKNMMMMGSRGFGKSYSVAGGVIGHEFLFDGMKEYSPEHIGKPPSTEIVASAGDAKFSADILKKTKFGMDNLPGYIETDDKFYPSPFAKQYSGSWMSAKEVLAEYKKKLGGTWQTRGSGSKIKHRTFKDNPFAANGTRPAVMVMEEIGMFSNLKAAHEASVECMKNGSYKFGSCMYLGTGGDMEGGGTIDARDMFYNPDVYDLISFNDEWEDKGKIAYFVPAYMGLNQYKDENGFTDEAPAKEYLEKFRDKLRSGKNSRGALDAELQNRPLKPSEVFLTKTGNHFPTADLLETLSQLEVSNAEKNLDYIGKLIVDTDGKVQWKPDAKLNPIYDYPLRASDDIEGCVIIHEMPYENGEEEIPQGMYIAGCDPYDHDEATTASLGSLIILNKLTNRIVAEYTGRPETANQYYEILRRLLKFYNAKCLYENERKGVYQYLEHKHETYLLLDQPDIIKDVVQNSRTQRGKGMHMSSPLKRYGEELIKMWLLETYGQDESLMNLHKIRSQGLLKELIAYNPNDNFDRVMAFMMVMYHIEEVKKHTVEKEKKISTIHDQDFWNKTLFKRGKRKTF
tara:strand:- start:5007 stop:7142 length:2136 start_codon:yes stop_codon:yes gene_type:complete